MDSCGIIFDLVVAIQVVWIVCVCDVIRDRDGVITQSLFSSYDHHSKQPTGTAWYYLVQYSVVYTIHPESKIYSVTVLSLFFVRP